MALTMTSSKNSASFLSYRKYCCFLLTRSGLNDLFDFDSSILQEIRESSSISDHDQRLISERRGRYNNSYNQMTHLLHSSSSSSLNQKMSIKLKFIAGIIWFIQYMIYSMLTSFFPIKSINIINNNDDNNNNEDIHNIDLYGVGAILSLSPFIALIFIPIFEKYTIIYKIGLSKCVVFGLLLQGLICILFGFIPSIIDNIGIKSLSSKQIIFYVINCILRIFSSILSVLIELSIMTIIIKITPRKILSRQQFIPLFFMIGLMTGPFLSGYLYYFTFNTNYQYQLSFTFIGCLIIISSIIIKLLMPKKNGNNNNNNISIKVLNAYRDINVIYSSLIAIYSLICITFILSILSLYLNNINPNKFNINNNSGIMNISGYYLAFGLSFIIMSFGVNFLVYFRCGSLRVMLSGLFLLSISLIFISSSNYIFIINDIKNDNHILSGLVLMGISTSFCITPYLLYLRNALFRKYNKQTTNVSFNVFRLSVLIGIMIGPIIGYITFSINHNLEIPLIILSIIALFISIFGFILFKCLRWEWVRYQIEDGNGLNSTPIISSLTSTPNDDNHHNHNDDKDHYEIRYIPILQDDKSFCCFCNNIMCFFSFGALLDKRHQHVKQWRDKMRKNRDKKRKRHRNGKNKKDKNEKSNKSKHKRSRKSFDETPDLDDENNDIVTGQIITIRKKSSKIYDRISFGGGLVEHEYTGMYGNDGKTVTKDNIPAPTPEDRRSSLILSHSWNTVLNNDAKLFLPPNASSTNTSDSAPNTESSNGSTLSPLSREKSRKLSKKDIATPRGDTQRAIIQSTQKNALKSRSSRQDDKDDRNDRDDEIELSVSRKNTNNNNNYNNAIFIYPEDRESDSELNNNSYIYKRRGSSGSPGSQSPFRTPTTPKFNQDYYQRNNQNMVRVETNRGIMIEHSVQSSATEAPSQTFLLLSDDDFASRKCDSDIYNDVPEVSANEYSIQ